MLRRYILGYEDLKGGKLRFFKSVTSWEETTDVSKACMFSTRDLAESYLTEHFSGYKVEVFEIESYTAWALVE